MGGSRRPKSGVASRRVIKPSRVSSAVQQQTPTPKEAAATPSSSRSSVGGLDMLDDTPVPAPTVAAPKPALKARPRMRVSPAKGKAKTNAVVELGGGDVTCARDSCGATPATATFWSQYEMVKFKGQVVRRPTFPACGPCYVTFLSSHAAAGKTWEEVATLCNEDPVEDEQFSLLVMRRTKPDECDPVAYRRSEITRGLDCGVRSSISRIGVALWRFERRFQYPPAELDITERAILAPNMTRFKGVVLVDDGLWGQRDGIVDLQFYGAVFNKKGMYVQELRDDIREGQSAEAWSSMTAHDAKGEDMDVRRHIYIVHASGLVNACFFIYFDLCQSLPYPHARLAIYGHLGRLTICIWF